MKIDVPLPKRLALTISIAWSRDSAWITHRTGPNTSSWAIAMSGVTPSSTVGPRKAPSGAMPSPATPRPSTTSVAPASTPRATQSAIRSRAAQEMTGPTSTDSSSPSPTCSARVASVSGPMSCSWASPTVTTTDPAMQRWPAAPNAEPRIPSTVLSTTASGMTTMWFLAPPRACTRLPCLAAPS